MEHFEIVQALCRSALHDASPAVRRQVERLHEALAEGKDPDQARALARLLRDEARSVELQPSRLRRSAAAQQALLPGEMITKATPAPVDRETSVPLAQLIEIDELPDEAPIFASHLTEAVEALLREWRHADQLSARGIPPSRTCLLYGEPGTGKTALALWIARQLGLPVALARLDGLISSFLGTTSRNMGALFSFASRYRCLLLLDEFDAFAKVRDDPQEVGEIKRVVNTLLQNLDQRSAAGLTIAVTNHPSLLDPAIWRRFELQISVPMPAFEQRLAIIERYFAPLKPDAAELKFIAWVAEGLSGAALESFVRNIQRHLIIEDASYRNATMHGFPKEFSLLDATKRYFSLNSHRIDSQRFNILVGPLDRLITTLKSSGTLNQNDIARIMRLSPAAISKRKMHARELSTV
ncbi:MAG TPA: ATP-binding protein [Candidatus Acidoferrales bacterium]|nr:ATP-binding protein [Candidatus Acidoferrales bacterium]